MLLNHSNNERVKDQSNDLWSYVFILFIPRPFSLAFIYLDILITRQFSSCMHTARLETVLASVSVATTKVTLGGRRGWGRSPYEQV